MQTHAEHEDNIVWYLTDGYWQDRGESRRKFDVEPGGYLTINIVDLPEADQKVARRALDAWEHITGIQFRDIEETDADPDDADIVFHNASNGEAHADITTYQGIISQSRVNIPADLTPPDSNLNEYKLHVYIHEIGHALGLGHPGDYNGPDVTVDDSKYPDDDANLFTTMSYFVKSPATLEFNSGFAVTPMLYDVMAIWALYGRPTAGVNAEDDRHMWTAFPDVSPGDDLATTATLVDTGGQDVLILGDTDDVVILDSGLGNDSLLKAGDVVGYGSINGRYVSPLGAGVRWYEVLGSAPAARGPAKDVSLMIYGTIENVEGGDGNDWLVGNAERNRLYGDAGDDVLEGSAGSDVLTGGSGTDAALYTLSPSGVTVRLHSHTLQGGDAEGDTWGTLITVQYEKNGIAYMETVPDIEALGGSRHDDILAGDSRANILWGNAGNDYLYGGPGGGPDQIYGGPGDDALHGGLGDDTLRGGPGEDVLTGGRGADTFVFAPGDSEGENGHTLNHVRDFDPAEGDKIDLSVWPGRSGVDDIQQSVGMTGLRLDLDQNGLWDVVLEGYFERITDVHVIFTSQSVVLMGTPADDILTGGLGNDELHGGGGNDELYGDAGNDELYGGPGGDFLFGEDGHDFLHGGPGRDTLSGLAGDDTLNGSKGDDTLIGGQGDDTLEGGDGKDELHGEVGNDELYGGDGFEWLYGGEGDDRLYSDGGYGVGIDGTRWGSELHAGPGDDYLEGSPYRDAMFGGPGDDELHGGAGDDLLYGYSADDEEGDGDDELYGGGGRDELYGGPGNDRLDGGGLADELHGGAGDDWLYGGDDGTVLYIDWLHGGPGADIFVFVPVVDRESKDVIEDFNPAEGDRIDLTAYDEIWGIQDVHDSTDTNSETGNERTWLDLSGDKILLADYTGPITGDMFIFAEAGQIITGTAGDDRLYGGPGTDRMKGGDGDDLLHGRGGNDWLYGEGGKDDLWGGDGDDELYGEYGDDHLNGGAGDDRLHGGAGNDEVYGEYGSNYLEGGLGDDTMLGGEGDDELHGGDGNDWLHGSDGDDKLYGGYNDDYLEGGVGNDYLSGGAWSDRLVGSLGDDTMRGGPGRDTFVFAPGDGSDTVTDFSQSDKIDVSAFRNIHDISDIAISQEGNDTLLDFIALDDGPAPLKILLEGVDAEVLSNVDFVFVS